MESEQCAQLILCTTGPGESRDSFREIVEHLEREDHLQRHLSDLSHRDLNNLLMTEHELTLNQKTKVISCMEKAPAYDLGQHQHLIVSSCQTSSLLLS